MSTEESSLIELCRVIIDRVYGALGTQLSAQRGSQLASELATEIASAILREMDEPMDETAWAATGQFFQDEGIAVVDDSWRWVN